MKEEIVKAYDIVIEQQRNADSKANLFIVLITAFLSYLGTIDTTNQSEALEGSVILLWLLLIPLFLLLFSLFPIYKSSFTFFKKRKNVTKINIFFWGSIVEIENDAKLIELFMKQYRFKKLTESEINLLIQIRTNSNILFRKTTFHKIAFYFLSHILIFFSVSLIYIFDRNPNQFFVFIIFLAIELIYHVYSFVQINKLVSLLNNIKKYLHKK